MFLCLSSNNQDWDKEQKLILLGDWCLDSKKNISNLDYKIMPYHWHNFSKYEKDKEYLFKLYKNLIPEITIILNKKNKINFSFKYWEMLIGPWLWMFIEVLYDRYSSLIQVTKEYKKLETKISTSLHSPSTFLDFYNIIQDDKYNFLLFSKIIEILDLPIDKKYINFDNKEIINEAIVKKKFSINIFYNLFNINKIKHYVKFFIKSISVFPLNHFINKINKFRSKNKFFWDLNLPLSFKQKKDLNYYLGTVHFTESKIPKKLAHDRLIIDEILFSKRINEIYQNDNFVILLSKIIFLCMPTEYNSDFNKSRDHYINFIPDTKPKVVGVRCANESNPIIRFCTAELTEKGSKILSCQEGGGEGAKIVTQINEEMNTRLCDIFLSWGWQNKNNNKIKPFFVTKYFQRNYNYDSSGNIILLGASCRKYYFSSSSGQFPTYNKKLIKYNTEFINNLNTDSFNKLIYRFHWDMGYHEKEILKKKFPKLKMSFREDETHFYNLLFKSKLIIITTDYTTNKQTFLLNHPTLLLWDDEYFKIRPEVKINYDILHNAGILYYSPYECSKKVNEIQKDPMSWWLSNDVQNAKNQFCNCLSRDASNISKELSKIIKNM